MQPKTTSASLRIVVAIVGAGICALAVWRLGLAVHQALTTGTVLLLDTKPMARGVVYPYPWVDAWAYFVGCALSAAGGVLVMASATGRWWLLLLAMLVFWIGFILAAAAPMLGSLSGAVLLVSVILGCSMFALVFGLWRSAREHRKLDMAPELQDRDRREDAA